MPFRILHAADLHLDSPLRQLESYPDAPLERIRHASREALQRLVELAIDQRVDLVLLAGDIYDGDWKDYHTGLFFQSQMLRLRDAGVPVVAISGNHDAESQISRSLTLPDNVRMLSVDQPETVLAADLGLDLPLAIHGQGFKSRHVADNVVERYPLRRSGCFNIGLLHTSLEGADGHIAYAPCSLGDLESRGYDYWALGHIHRRAVLRERPFVAYPGNLQGRHIKETGPKGCLLATIDERLEATVAFHPLDVFRWELLAIDPAECDTPDDLLVAAAARLDELLAELGSQPAAVRLEVAGATPAHHALRRDEDRLLNELRSLGLERGRGQLWIEKVRCQTTPPRTAEPLDLDGPLGELSALLAELRDSDDELQRLAKELAPLHKALPAELREPQGHPEPLLYDRPTTVRALLDDVEALLLARLTGEDGGP